MTSREPAAPAISEVTDPPPRSPSPEPPWRRLDSRMILVDAVQTLLALTPAVAAVTIFGVEPSLGTLWPALAVAAWGVVSAGTDALRWIKTRYRITDEYVEGRTGLLVRQYRSVRRDRIRSVDTTATLRHRLGGLRVVSIGAGQQANTGEAALALDAISRSDAERLRRDLLGEAAPAAAATGDQQRPEPPSDPVLAELRWSWIGYNLFSVWAYLAAAGVLWGAMWLGGSVGLDLVGWVTGLLDWRSLGWFWSVMIGFAAISLLGVGVLATGFVTEYWRFRLTRVPRPEGSALRTSQGLFKTRQIDRDEGRIRGIQISEPVLWRWLGVADTNVISTGLNEGGLSPASTILPRGPVTVARRVAAEVLRAAPNPLTAPLRPHPAAAGRRRYWWGIAIAAAVVAAAGIAATTIEPVPNWAPLLASALLPLTLLAAAVAYRALGHTLAGSYLVVRSGLVSRATVALHGGAIVGWRLRQSLWQRRLGLLSLTATTAAGYGAYEATDLAADDALALADQAAPGLLRPFLLTDHEPGGDRSGDPPPGSKEINDG
ncbi:PH domain-containing protein [Natronosporangium hydrolyticum]|uniref:PH domain-containing protein n=1 Tax=Natronosporangium hydrolyticum TaxID=2811111 RepID=A0A895Y4U0_9ACTN|nr:PH domain-containing protein [Natronosporangium hydrolyticum]QSB12707.1 PH domain-containing protein [Natronosporangium hydrolyticum]